MWNAGGRSTRIGTGPLDQRDRRDQTTRWGMGEETDMHINGTKCMPDRVVRFEQSTGRLTITIQNCNTVHASTPAKGMAVPSEVN